MRFIDQYIWVSKKTLRGKTDFKKFQSDQLMDMFRRAFFQAFQK